MVAVPAVTPVTTPRADTDALPELLLQPPNVPVVLSVIVDATQTTFGPLIVPAFGNGLMVTTLVAAAVPQLFVTV